MEAQRAQMNSYSWNTSFPREVFPKWCLQGPKRFLFQRSENTVHLWRGHLLTIKIRLKNVNIAAFAIKGELHSFVFHFSLTTAYPTSKSAHCILGMSINKQFPVKHGKGRTFTAFSLKRAAASESLLQIQLCIFTCVLLPNPFSSSLHHNINSK